MGCLIFAPVVDVNASLVNLRFFLCFASFLFFTNFTLRFFTSALGEVEGEEKNLRIC